MGERRRRCRPRLSLRVRCPGPPRRPLPARPSPVPLLPPPPPLPHRGRGYPSLCALPPDINKCEGFGVKHAPCEGFGVKHASTLYTTYIVKYTRPTTCLLSFRRQRLRPLLHRVSDESVVVMVALKMGLKLISAQRRDLLGVLPADAANHRAQNHLMGRRPVFRFLCRRHILGHHSKTVIVIVI